MVAGLLGGGDPRLLDFHIKVGQRPTSGQMLDEAGTVVLPYIKDGNRPTVTELVYRHQLRPVIQTGAIVMDELFAPRSDR